MEAHRVILLLLYIQQYYHSSTRQLSSVMRVWPPDTDVKDYNQPDLEAPLSLLWCMHARHLQYVYILEPRYSTAIHFDCLIPRLAANLQGLWLHGNVLTELPQDLGNLVSLETVSLAGNRIGKLPDSVTQLTKLKDLTLSGNLLKDLPSSIGGLGKSLVSKSLATED